MTIHSGTQRRDGKRPESRFVSFCPICLLFYKLFWGKYTPLRRFECLVSYYMSSCPCWFTTTSSKHIIHRSKLTSSTILVSSTISSLAFGIALKKIFDNTMMFAENELGHGQLVDRCAIIESALFNTLKGIRQIDTGQRCAIIESITSNTQKDIR